MRRPPLYLRTFRSIVLIVALVSVAVIPGVANAADLAPPDGRLTTPAVDQVVTASTVAFSGVATDDVGVAAVDVAIRNRATLQWLRLDGTWGAQQWWATTLTRPRTTWTRWSFSRSLPDGNYAVTVRARDTSGKVDPTRPWVRFSVATVVPTGKPNVVLILTDDQRFDTLWSMPKVQSLLVDHGVTFTNGIVANALCCPSRANILKGAYSHTTRVYQNSGTFGPFSAFDDRSTIGTWMKGAGYRTALMGKYFNGYTEARASSVPPGWDRWVAFATTDVGGGRYYDYTLSIDGASRYYGTAPAAYSTDVLATFADQFIRSTPASTPLYLHFTPYGPHEQATAAPRHLNTFADLAPARPPNFGEPDVSDKPTYIRNLPPMESWSISRVDSIRRKQFQTLQSVDDAVSTIVDALADTGRLENTMIVFTSDNGFLWGEHRWGTTGPHNKQVPYEESIKVPYVVRYDPLTSTPRTDASLVMNIDLAPTFTALAGVPAPGAEGRSLLPILTTPGSAWRTDVLIEHHLTDVPSYCAVRSTSALYVRYGNGEEEFYPLAIDPYELQNRIGDPAYATTITAMRARARELCSPPPPGYSFTSTYPTTRVRHINTR
jgi:N-acetylglucosamine-6-sulfatase